MTQTEVHDCAALPFPPVMYTIYRACSKRNTRFPAPHPHAWNPYATRSPAAHTALSGYAPGTTTHLANWRHLIMRTTHNQQSSTSAPCDTSALITTPAASYRSNQPVLQKIGGKIHPQCPRMDLFASILKQVSGEKNNTGHFVRYLSAISTTSI